MQVNISSLHFKADKKLLEFIKLKLEKLPNFYEGVLGSNVTLRLGNNGTHENKITEIRLMVKGYDLFARKECKSFEESTDQAVEALRRQLKKHKEKLVEVTRK